LLEPGGGVHGVSRHEPLTGRRIACDHFAGVDAGAVADRDAPAPLELLVEDASRSRISAAA